ncbi:MAG TPA: efflux transporter periplasmic adaptor subunit [Prolixibacteraceae bacterium]|jgi:cobalt-zinc-cadmium efflux system membrane fusion protein|nr:efflux transporter periplasmic adaptor subunit [Prolixibacteraceae bacterium]
MSKYRFIKTSLFSLSLIVLIACNSAKKTNEAKVEEEVIPDNIVEMRDDQIKLAHIETGAIEMRLLSGTLKVNGIIAVAPQNQATVCAPMGGFIKSTTLMPGNSVSKGQTLAVIENQDFVDMQQSYFEAKNKFEFAEADYKRHTELYKDEVYSEQNLQQVTVDYKTLKAQVKSLEQKLSLIGIDPANLHEETISSSVALHSPISGFVTAVNVNLGKFVSPSDVLFTIVNSDKLFLELSLYEKDADKVAKGQKIRFFINNETEQHDAVILQTGQSVSVDKTYKVYASVTGVCKNVLPGMYVNAVVETSGNTVAALPQDAVVSFDDKDYIFIFDKNKVEDGKPFSEYEIVEVHKGVTDNGYTEIVLPEGFNITTAKVVIKGAYNLLSAKKNAGEMAC